MGASREYLKNQISRLRYLLYIMVGFCDGCGCSGNFADRARDGSVLQAGWLDFCDGSGRLHHLPSYAGCVDETCGRSAVRTVRSSFENKSKDLISVNMENAVEYAREKYHVNSAAEFKEQWEYYLEAVKEREKYQRTNDDLDYFKGRLCVYLPSTAL